jgi:hypothetical protein
MLDPLHSYRQPITRMQTDANKENGLFDHVDIITQYRTYRIS